MITDKIHGVLNSKQLTEYLNDGFVTKRGLFSREEMAVFKDTVIKTVRQRQPDCENGVPVFFLDDMPEPFLEFCTNPRLTAIVHQLLGPRIEFLSVKPVHKNATVNYPSAWHQDYAYWRGSNKLSIWIALDDATVENGCLRFLPNAHRSFIKHSRKDGSFGSYLSEEQLELGNAIDAPMAAGDACFFIDLAPHASHGNVSGRDRWSFIPTYRNADQPDSSEIWKETITLTQ